MIFFTIFGNKACLINLRGLYDLKKVWEKTKINSKFRDEFDLFQIAATITNCIFTITGTNIYNAISFAIL